MSLRLHISIAKQQLQLLRGNDVLKTFTISTAKNGPGEKSGSGCTPRGQHYVRAKIGDNQPINAVFVGRRPTGEIYHPELAAQFPQRDWILSRILWLCGNERGKNRLGDVDTMRRYIYIHGTPDSEPMGIPLSHGCVRMQNQDIMELFAAIPPYCPVYIE
ncbi:MAG: L,D-transpeptidase [Gammaproteobacteria bacterium]|nr:L,D-transpeptidase [Gammaproteobacteria bacterium]